MHAGDYVRNGGLSSAKPLSQAGRVEPHRSGGMRKPIPPSAARKAICCLLQCAESQRARKLDRCLNRGEEGLARWVGWRILTSNLVVMATKLTRRKRRLKVES